MVSKTNRIYGFEALLRWQHPMRGMISPDDFIPILENSAHMIELGYWIIRCCFKRLIEMKEQGKGYTVFSCNQHESTSNIAPPMSIPVFLNLTLKGISGLKMGQCFMINNEI